MIVSSCLSSFHFFFSFCVFCSVLACFFLKSDVSYFLIHFPCTFWLRFHLITVSSFRCPVVHIFFVWLRLVHICGSFFYKLYYSDFTYFTIMSHILWLRFMLSFLHCLHWSALMCFLVPMNCVFQFWLQSFHKCTAAVIECWLFFVCWTNMRSLRSNTYTVHFD